MDPKQIDPQTGRLKEASKDGTESASQKPIKKMKKTTLPTAVEENPCGKGWYKAADGQCYPRLN